MSAKYSPEQVEQLEEVLREVRDRLVVLQADPEAKSSSVSRLQQVEQEIVAKLDQFSEQRPEPATRLFEHTVLYRASTS